MTRSRVALLPWLALCGVATPAARPSAQATRPPEHVVVWRHADRYGGWPANHGIWAWDDEILVGFSAGHMKAGAVEPGGGPARHPIDRSRPEQHLLARSRDGGRSWAVEHPPDLVPPPEPGHIAGVPTEPGGRPVHACDGVDLSRPDFVMTLRMSDINRGPSWYFRSSDRGRSWDGPCALDVPGVPHIAARTDYIVAGAREALVFLTSAKANAREGRPFVARTIDGGASFERLAWIGPEPANGFVIMPSTVRLEDGTLLTAVRRQGSGGNGIDIFRSSDGGRSWTAGGTAVEDTGRGNPPSLVRLRDGRLALTYGYRAEPFGIRARISRDDGRSWSADRILRDDARDWDLGYTRSVQRRDGRIVTVYYYNDGTSPERYIAATIWDPGP